DLTLLSHVDADHFIDARCQIIIFVAGETSNANDLAGFTVWNLHGGVANFTSLLTEDCAQKTLFCGQLGFTLRRHLTDEDVASVNIGLEAEDAAVIQVT